MRPAGKAGGLPGLTAKELGVQVIVLDEVDSTNRYLKDHMEELPHGAMCYSAYQNAGRGRLGRGWTAPKGETLAMSVLFRRQGPAEQLPLLCGMAAAAALDALAGGSFAIKWPNDIVCSNRKVCGILCESRLSGGGLAVVAGIGVNLRQTAAWFEGADLPHAGSVEQLTGARLAPEETAAAILNRLEPLWERCRLSGFGALREEYERRCVNVGRQVRVLSPDGAPLLEGVAAGVGEDGSLLIRDGKGGVRAVNAGEASVRGLDGYV